LSSIASVAIGFGPLTIHILNGALAVIVFIGINPEGGSVKWRSIGIGSSY